MVSSDRHRYVVAVDFGTTFTGISYVNATKKMMDDIFVIKNWPGPSKEFTEVWKTPSKIAYRSENSHMTNIKDDADEIIWGYDVEPGMTSYSWMKLRLDEHTKITEFDDSSLAGLADSQGGGLLLLPPGKSATEVCADYLTGVYKYTMAEMNRTFGENIVEATPIDFWVTVPATWSDRAKSLTKTAALTAGFCSRTSDRMSLITEPEAAAVAALSGLNGDGMENQLHPGDGILVCDCGGGTVDINTYRIQSTTPTLEFEELAVGQGGKVGSTFIDRQFYEWMGSHFGFAFYNLDLKKKGPGSKLMKEFEALKRDFSGRNAQKEFRIEFYLKGARTSKYYDAEDPAIIISRDDMESFFVPSVTKIKDLLKAQIIKANAEMPGNKTIRTIILVGGFGDSKYLHHALSQWCLQNGHLRIICPPNPQAAIVKGAALRGLNDIKPTRRRCRRHYGFIIASPFIEGVHPQRLAYTHEWSGFKYCDKLMKWQIGKGDYVTEQTKISTTLHDPYFVGDSKSQRMTLYASSVDQPAKYFDRHNPNIERIGEIVYDLEDLDFSRFPTKIINGRRAYYISYDVEVHMGSKQGTLIFKLVSYNEEIGTATLDFNKLETTSTGNAMEF